MHSVGSKLHDNVLQMRGFGSSWLYDMSCGQLQRIVLLAHVHCVLSRWPVGAPV